MYLPTPLQKFQTREIFLSLHVRENLRRSLFQNDVFIGAQDWI
jgi:hypothetical protein